MSCTVTRESEISLISFFSFRMRKYNKKQINNLSYKSMTDYLFSGDYTEIEKETKREIKVGSYKS
jgi:hypothetical protein